MTTERLDEILQGVQELREWWKSEGRNKFYTLIPRTNGKSMTAYRYARSIEIVCAAMSDEEICAICVHYGTHLCAECIRGCDTDYFLSCCEEITPKITKKETQNETQTD